MSNLGAARRETGPATYNELLRFDEEIRRLRNTLSTLVQNNELITSHNNLTNLTAGNPHTQYLLKTTAASTYAPVGDYASGADVTALTANFTGLSGVVNTLDTDFTALSGSLASEYLKLDCSNDPLTASLHISGQANSVRIGGDTYAINVGAGEGTASRFESDVEYFTGLGQPMFTFYPNNEAYVGQPIFSVLNNAGDHIFNIFDHGTVTFGEASANASLLFVGGITDKGIGLDFRPTLSGTGAQLDGTYFADSFAGLDLFPAILYHGIAAQAGVRTQASYGQCSGMVGGNFKVAPGSQDNDLWSIIGVRAGVEVWSPGANTYPEYNASEDTVVSSGHMIATAETARFNMAYDSANISTQFSTQINERYGLRIIDAGFDGRPGKGGTKKAAAVPAWGGSKYDYGVYIHKLDDTDSNAIKKMQAEIFLEASGGIFFRDQWQENYDIGVSGIAVSGTGGQSKATDATFINSDDPGCLDLHAPNCIRQYISGVLVQETTSAGVSPTYSGVWKTLRGSIRDAASSNATFTASPFGSIDLFRFDDATQQRVMARFTMPHDYKEGTDVKCVLHWFPDQNGSSGEDVKWVVQYNVSNVGEVLNGATFLETTSKYPDDSALVQYKHYRSEIGTISSGLEVGSSIVMRLYRDAADITDDFPERSWMLDFVLHYQADGIGSSQEYDK